ncbi:peptidase domain-containing ABC transporter [Stigmatella sp. ncwal1]|uniref:Peptidase domain-containing ABC transporter n=1 Tax=Stigmatella ashevillensis TaxID=2995309 RepID=A0ABT5D3V9_9BACT|nr:peptidase domain-containing ABC transporter [Stigmatella ashevillena]MDC0708261.1 peptidase domain-containing ABC transporter [Stigmatella ashevillena]
MAEKRSALPRRLRLLARLMTAAPRAPVPYVAQRSEAERDAACMVMALGCLGRQVSLDGILAKLREPTEHSKVDALHHAARALGLRVRSVGWRAEELGYLEPGTLLHDRRQGTVVFERLTARTVVVVDPAVGRRSIPLTRVEEVLTGEALLLEPTAAFQQEDTESVRVKELWWRMLRSGLLWRILGGSALLQLFAIGPPALSGVIIDQVVPHGDWPLLGLLTSGLALILGCLLLASLVRAHLLLQLRTWLEARMTFGLLEHLVELPISFFQRHSLGDLMGRVGNAASVRELLTAGTLSGALDGVLVSVFLVVLFAVSLPMGLVVLGFGALQALVLFAASTRQRQLLMRSLESEARSESFLVELLTGIQTVKAMGKEPWALGEWSRRFSEVLDVSRHRGRLGAWVEAAMGALQLGAPLAVLCFGAWMLLQGAFSLGTLLTTEALALGLLRPLSGLLSTVMQFQLLEMYLSRASELLEAAPEKAFGRPAPLLQGEVVLDSVSFRYEVQGPLVVQDVSVRIQPGQMVAIVGSSGAGKSTLASLLMGMVLPTSGRILYDGMDLTELELRSVRRQLGIVMQSSTLFAASVRQNITLGYPSATMDEVRAAVRLAHLQDDIHQMPMRYETPLIDRGMALSGGQRQRLALARALVHEPAILLLDEATSSLDAVTEHQVQQTLEQLQCTRIVIAHRLSTVRRADLILYMEGGRIMEAGTHEALLARQGAYAALISAQLG